MALASAADRRGSPVSRQLSRRRATRSLARSSCAVVRHPLELRLLPAADEPRVGWAARYSRSRGDPEPALGLSQPFVGAIADKWGTARTIVGGSLLYILGVYLMSTTSSPARAVFQRRVLVGLGLSGTGFGVVLAAVGRSVPAERRSVALGITAAVGSLGQFLLPPIGQAFLSTYGWQTALALLAFGSIAMVFAAGGLRGRVESAGQNQQTIREALAEEHSRLSLPHRRLLRMRLARRLHRGASARLSGRRRHLDRDRRLVPGAGGPVQRDRLVLRGRARRPAQQGTVCRSSMPRAPC